MIVLLASIVLAAEPPKSPTVPTPLGHECVDALAIPADPPLSEGVTSRWSLEDGPVTACSGVLMPTSEAENLVLRDAYATDLENLYRKDTTALEVEMKYRSYDKGEDAVKNRWLGRLDVLGAVAIGVGVALAMKD